jgi:outer membrane protein TolC
LPYSRAFAYTKLTWDDCYSQFNNNNPNKKAAEFTLKSAQLQHSSALSSYWPQLSLSANSILGASPQSLTKPKDTSTSLTLTQNLFAGFATEATVNLAKTNILSNKVLLQEVYSSLLNDLKIAYADLLFAQKTNKLLLDIIARRKQNFDMVKLRFNNGKENKGSVLLAEAYLKLAQFEKFQNENIIKLAQHKIKSLLAIDDDDIELVGDINSRAITNQNNYQVIIENHPAHQQAVAQQQQAEANLLNDKSTFYPNINLQYTYNNSGENFKFDKNSWSTGINLSWSLFNGGKNYYASQSQIELKNARDLQLIATDRTILEKLLLAKNQLLEAIEKHNVDNFFLKAALVREQISRSKYNNGLSNFDDWDQMEGDLIAREKNLLKSEHDKIVSEAAWIKALGKGALE